MKLYFYVKSPISEIYLRPFCEWVFVFDVLDKMPGEDENFLNQSKLLFELRSRGIDYNINTTMMRKDEEEPIIALGLRIQKSDVDVLEDVMKEYSEKAEKLIEEYPDDIRSKGFIHLKDECPES